MNILIMFIIVFFSAALLTGVIRHYAIAHDLIDIPNARSSHHLPTPRGGGLAIISVFLICLPLYFFLDIFSLRDVLAFGGAGALVGIVGYFDDRNHVQVSIRLLVHFFAAVWLLLCLVVVSDIPLLNSVPLMVFSICLAVLYLMWLLNLYNFMDGIDGLAGVEAVCVCLGSSLLYFLCDDKNDDYWPLIMLAATVTGFLYWNFPPAKIFMGDSGSGFLGMVLGGFSIKATVFNPQFFWSWLILLGIFIVDASWTLMSRLLNGEKCYEAHRSHAYQRAAQKYGSHKFVTLMIGAINLCWLLPIALWVGSGAVNGVFGLSIAYLPLAILAAYFKAGTKDVFE